MVSTVCFGVAKQILTSESAILYAAKVTFRTITVKFIIQNVVIGCTTFIITGRLARSAAMPASFLLTGPKMGFIAPQGRHVASINVNVGVRERTAGPLPCANFHFYRGKNVRIQPPKLSKFRILARNFHLRGDAFASFLGNSQRLYASIGSF